MGVIKWPYFYFICVGLDPWCNVWIDRHTVRVEVNNFQPPSRVDCCIPEIFKEVVFPQLNIVSAFKEY
jgi:hypothetical protein